MAARGAATIGAEPACAAEAALGHHLERLCARLVEALPERDGLTEARVAGWLARDRAVVRALARVEPGLRPRERFVVAEEMAPPALPLVAPLPALPSPGALAAWLGWRPAQLDGHADLADRHRREPARRDYRRWWRGSRLIEAPKDELRRAQRAIAREILARVEPHPCAHGFVRGRSAATHAARHAGSERVLRVDLRSFFGSVHRRRIRGLFAAMGYPPEVARTLAALCTTATPPDVSRELPWAAPHLPQGAPSSPALANLVAYRLDARCDGLARRFGATYTRYADDLTFSGGRDAVGPRLLSQIAAIVADEGFAVRDDKTRLVGRSRSQRVTGLVVNVRPALPRRERDALKAALHAAAVHGPSTRLSPERGLDTVAALEAHLRGRVAHACGVDPVHGPRLRALFERIDWGGVVGPAGLAAPPDPEVS